MAIFFKHLAGRCIRPNLSVMRVAFLLCLGVAETAGAGVVGKGLLCTDSSPWLRDELRHEIFSFKAGKVEYHSPGFPKNDKIRLKTTLLDYFTGEKEIVIHQPLHDAISGAKLAHYVMTINRRTLVMTTAGLTSASEVFKRTQCELLTDQDAINFAINDINTRIQKIYDKRLEDNKI